MSVDELRDSSARRMDDEAIREQLLEEGVGVLSLPTEDIPNLRPMSFGYDGGSEIYFTSHLFGMHSQKAELSDSAEIARFLMYSVASTNDWQTGLLTGQITAVPDDGWDRLRAAMENSWHPELFSAATPMRGSKGYQFRIEEQTGIQHRRA